MEHLGFILGSYAVTAVSIVGYAVWVLRSARRLGRNVKEQDRPWT